MKKYFCTKCFNNEEIDKIIFICDNKNEHINNKEVRYTFSPNVFNDKFPHSAICPSCSKRSTIKICSKCGSELVNPETIKIVSIAGSKGSGKTVYLGSLYSEIMKTLSVTFNLSVTPTRETENNYESNYKISQGNYLPETTQKGKRDPFVFKLLNNKNREINLVIYDSAGEDFDRTNKEYNENVTHLNHTSLIVLLVDILQIKSVRDSVNTDFKLTHGIGDLRKNDHILTVIHEEFRKNNGLNNTFSRYKKIKTPIAVTLSLIDILINKYQDNLSDKNYLQKSDHLNFSKFDTLSFENISNGVYEFLKEQGEKKFLYDLRKNFRTVNFFAISSLGGEPFNNKVKYNTPHNVLDPIIWLLHKEKFLLK